jgi:hypothetical protein
MEKIFFSDALRNIFNVLLRGLAKSALWARQYVSLSVCRVFFCGVSNLDMKRAWCIATFPNEEEARLMVRLILNVSHNECDILKSRRQEPLKI